MAWGCYNKKNWMNFRIIATNVFGEKNVILSVNSKTFGKN
jgi:hypothetical protein